MSVPELPSSPVGTASTCSPGTSCSLPQHSHSRSLENQQWDRFFKPRVALERALSSSTASSAASSPSYAASFSLLCSPSASASSPQAKPTATATAAESQLQDLDKAEVKFEVNPSNDSRAQTRDASRSCVSRSADLRAMQEFNMALVSHEFRIEPSNDLQFDTVVTSITRCSQIVRDLIE